jgi:hypothetical protein
MTSGNPNGQNGHHRDSEMQLVPDQVAELAAELSEAQTTSRRRKLARQVTDLVGKSREASVRGARAGGQASARGARSGGEASLRTIRSGGEASVRGVRSGGGASIRGLRSGGEASLRTLRSGGQAAWTGVQSGGQFAGKGLQALGQRLASETLEMAPKIPIRSIETLREQYPGRGTEELADAVIDGAARASAGVGAAIGAAAAIPFIPSLAVELGVETLTLVAVELKLIAELHEIYGRRAPGGRTQRMIAYVWSWADRRGVRITASGVAVSAGSPLWRKLERRLVTKAGKSVLSLAPMLTGAAAGAVINHRETRKLGNQVRADLRKLAGDAKAISGEGSGGD